MCLENLTSSGTTYLFEKLIFVGARCSNKKEEQQVKGVLAHELCHYAMKLVFYNNEKPYYKNNTDMKERFEKIVEDIKKNSIWLNDECNGIISAVFNEYSNEEFHQELIVTVVHILAAFDDNQQKSKYLQEIINLKKT